MSVSAAADRPDDTLISEKAPPSSQAVSGMLLLVCALVALVWANSPWAPQYFALTHLPIAGTTLLHAINDGLMAVFFLLVGLEIKHEMQDGALSTVRRAALPVVGALGGMILPALLYLMVARGTDAQGGWGIPMATDIAFALGIVALLGDRVPAGLRIFLAALAIADDIGAVLVIAVFYTPAVDWGALGHTACLLGVLFLLNFSRIGALWPYIVFGLALWWAVYLSGIHASIAGVLLAFTIPARGADCVQSRLEHALHTPVTYVIVPLFAFANAGVAVPTDVVAFASQPAVLATTVGLLVGKPLGIFTAAWLAVRVRWAELPSDSDWLRVLGVALLGGIGFTMSLFIASLAFGEGPLLDAAKVGVLVGSLVVGAGGALLLSRGAREGAATMHSNPLPQ